MMSTLFSLHTYLMMNAAIILSYPFAKILLKLPLIKQKLLQRQQLKLARFCFLLAISLFSIMPIMAGWLSIEHSNLEFKPIIHHASQSFLRHHDIVAAEISSAKTLSTQFGFNKIVLLIWMIGFLFFSFKLMRTLFSLNTLAQLAFCQHKINRVHVLFSNSTQVPFCWSSLRTHYIAIPLSFLEKENDMRLGLRHELQHIRQRDTYWLLFMTGLNLVCFWNPCFKLWRNWFNELQEFACDENIILRRKTSPSQYAQCLINTALSTVDTSLLPDRVLSINGPSQSILYRRINMLFHYKNQKRKFALVLAYSFCFGLLASAAYALNGSSTNAPLTGREVASIIKEAQVNDAFHVTANREVIDKINSIRSNKNAKKSLLNALDRMKMYQSTIEDELRKNAMPTDLLVLPLVESGYRPLKENENPVLAAGIWQIIPSTAKNLGLTIDKERDERLDTQRSTQAALTYLSMNYKIFHDWKLAVLAYEIGEEETARLIKATGSRDAWVIARSSHVPDKYKKELNQFLAMLDASIIIMHNPSLITQ